MSLAGFRLQVGRHALDGDDGVPRGAQGPPRLRGLPLHPDHLQLPERHPGEEEESIAHCILLLGLFGNTA